MSFALEPDENRIFISYAHETKEQKQSLLEYADWLNNPGGLECWIDRYAEDGELPEGWPAWMQKQIAKAEYVLVVCTKTYLERLMQDPSQIGKGKGAKFESTLMLNDFYDNHSLNKKYIPVIVTADHAQYIPKFLSGQTHYNLEDTESKEGLYRRLIKQPLHPKPKTRRGLTGIFSKENIPVEIKRVNLTDNKEIAEEIKPLLDMKPGTKILQSFFALPAARRFEIAKEHGLVEEGEKFDAPAQEKLSASFLKRAFSKNRLADLWSKLFDETIDPNPFKK